MAARSVNVRLKAGITSATLPDNRVMRPDSTLSGAGPWYLISLDDYAKITNASRLSVIDTDFQTVDTIVPAWNGTNYALDITENGVMNNTAALPTKGGKTFKLGEVIQGFNDSAFKLVKLVDAVEWAASQNVATWSDKEAAEVTLDVSAGTGDFAGVFVADVDTGNYGWIQISGIVPAAGAGDDVSEGDQLALSVNDGKLTDFNNEQQTVEVTGGSAAEQYRIKLTGGADSAPINWDASATTVRTAIGALAEVGGIANVTVSGTGENATPYVITFVGDLAGKSMPILVEGAAVGGGTVSLVVTRVTAGGGNDINPTTVAVANAAATGGGGSKVAEITLRDNTSVNRHVKRAKLFYDK